MAQLNFDATQVAPDLGFETVPAGWYNAMIDESEMKPTKDGSGAYLQTRFNIIDGQYANRKIYMRLNLRNTNPVAQEIAYKQLSAIAHAVGVLHVQDSSQLHGLPMKIKVKLRKDTSGQYEDSNEISSIKNINEQVDMGSQAGAAPAGFGGASAGGMPPGFGAQPQAGFAAPMQQAPVQQPAAQPWQQPAQPAPQAAPQQQWQQPAPQPQQAPAQAAPVQQPWQQPAAAQPWQQAPVQQAPVQQAAPQQAAPQQDHPAQSAVPPWAQPQQ